MASPKKGENPPVPGLLIVARDQRELYRAFQLVFGESQKVTVILDRRRKNRRRRGAHVSADRRRMERRSLSHIEGDLRHRQYELVRAHYRRPHG
jgi:hypothetical protein